MHTRTKIVCTIGPAVASFDTMVELIGAGMSVARLNFSHGTEEEHIQNVNNLKKAREKTGKPLAIMLDTKGPEIRVGKVDGDAMPLQPKQRVRLVGPDQALAGEIPVHPAEVFASMAVGLKVLFDDGYILSEVVETGVDYAVIEILNPGVLKSGKGVNMPGAHLQLPAMTPKDVRDLHFGCKHDVDLIAASFIRSAHNVLAIKQRLAQEGKPDILVVAKIENHQGVENFDSIVQVADGIMVARGDLGVEVNLASVPRLQKMMIRKCYEACKPVVTATQMLESMIINPRPTRAEVSDVANAIYDCTSSVMLSGETAIGKYPVETVRCMQSIVREAEADFDYEKFFNQNALRDYHDLSSAVALSAVKTAYSIGASAIFAFTTSGRTARLVSRLRPSMPIIAVTSSKKIYQQLAFNWGVIPVLCEGCKDSKVAFTAASEFALKHGLISFGDVVVITSGSPFGKQGSTNLMRVENVGNVAVRGHKGIGAKVQGRVSFALASEGAEREAFEKRLVVLTHCDASFLPILKNAAGMILQNHIGDTSSEKYAATIAKTFSISLITRADGALTLLKEGDEVTLDPQKGIVYRGTEEAQNFCSLLGYT